MDYRSYCVHCMADKGSAEVCPVCGFREGEAEENPLYLKPRTVLSGRYLIGRVLGHGGFGITYLALDIKLGNELAIKEYFPHSLATRAPGRTELTVYTGDARKNFTYGLEKFIEEAKMLARFNDHPCIISVYDFFEENGTGYMVMEYITGITFKEYIDEKGGRIEFETALEVMSPIMDALREVHGKGLLHRDISPDNIYITAKKQVKLLDFGAARYAVGEQSQSLSVILKPGYAPEEQYRSKGEQGPWTDVYAAAATIYRAVTGAVPPEALDRLNHDDLQTPSGFGVKMPAGVEKALLKALAVKAEDRFQSIRELQEAFVTKPSLGLGKKEPERAAQERPPIPGETTARTGMTGGGKTRFTFKRGWIVAGLIALVGLAAAYGVYWGINRWSKVARIQTQAASDTQTVPDAVGRTFADARALMEGRELTVKMVEAYSDKEAQGIIITQSYAPGTRVKPGTVVVLEVSKGSENGPEREPENVVIDNTVTVPSVMGETYPSAVGILTNRLLKVKRFDAYDDNAPKDTVIAQDPPANAKVKKNTWISLTISSGAKAKTVKMPAVVSQSFDEAQKALSALGLKAEKDEVYSDSMAKGQVIAQEPAPGSLLPLGTAITLKVSLGPKKPPKPAPLQVKIWTDKPEYKQGEKVKVYISGNKPFYARIVYRDASGNIVQILPNPYRKSNHFSGGVTYGLPSVEDQYELEVSPPFGTETVLVYACTEQLGPIDISDTGAGIYAVHDSLNEVARKSRGISVKPKKDNAQSMEQGAEVEFAEAQVSLRTAE